MMPASQTVPNARLLESDGHVTPPGPAPTAAFFAGGECRVIMMTGRTVPRRRTDREPIPAQAAQLACTHIFQYEPPFLFYCGAPYPPAFVAPTEFFTPL
jgi:hypothetical protein